MKFVPLELGSFQARAVLVGDEGSGQALVVDPGFDAQAIVRELRIRGWVAVAIALTHAHLDHAAGVATVKAAFPAAPVLLHADDLPLYHNLPAQAEMFGFPPPATVPEDGHLVDGQILRLGPESLVVRHCPGHSPGHVVLIGDDGGRPVAVVGDVLFAGSVGRTDLWGGSFAQLERSIREVLYILPERTRVVAGHGPETTIGAERLTNPFVAARREP